MWVLARTASEPLGLAAAVKEQIKAIDKEVPVADITSMEQILSESVADRRFNMSLLGILALVALLLAVVGIYSVMAHSTSQRAHEIGIRMALGADAGDVLKLVVRQGLVLTLIGVAAGLIGAFALTRVMTNLLFEVNAIDPLTFALIPLLLTAVALVASYIPARRATRVDPLVALRYE